MSSWDLPPRKSKSSSVGRLDWQAPRTAGSGGFKAPLSGGSDSDCGGQSSRDDGLSPATTVFRLGTTVFLQRRRIAVPGRFSVVPGGRAFSPDDGSAPATTIHCLWTVVCLQRRRFFSRGDRPSSREDSP